MRIQDDTRIKFREDGREGIIDGLTELVVGLGRNSDSRMQYRINVGDLDRTLVIEDDDLLALTDEDSVVLMLKQKGEYRHVVTQQL